MRRGLRMRQACRVVSPAAPLARRHVSPSQVTREVALRRWGALKTEREAKAGVSLIDLTAAVVRPRNPSIVRSTDVKWRLEERLDYSLRYFIPLGWETHEKVSDNLISVQCHPPRPLEPPKTDEERMTIPSVHGLSLNCFAYHRKVIDPDAAKLLVSFLKRFGSAVNNSVVVHRQRYYRTSGPFPAPPAPPGAQEQSDHHASTASNPSDTAPDESSFLFQQDLVDFIAARIGGAVCELSFTPPSPAALDTPPAEARGLCRAFYSKSKRVHVVVMMAVPVDEYAVMRDAVAQGVMHVTDVTIRDV